MARSPFLGWRPCSVGGLKSSATMNPGQPNVQAGTNSHVSELAEATGNRRAAIAVGRSYGALFFSVFGTAWLLLAVYAFGRLSRFVEILFAVAIVLFVAAAMQIQRRGKEAAKNAYPEDEQKRNDRAFGIVNAVTWIAVFLEFQILTRLGRQDLAIAGVVLIVGLHFFPMPPLYRHRANLVTGAFLVVWSILCAVLFKGDRMIGVAALGAGVALWISAAWALTIAGRLLKSANL